jgi:hypothetical protein
VKEHIAVAYSETEVDSLDRMLHEKWGRFDLTVADNCYVVEAHPGNGTRYSFILVKVNHTMAAQMGLNPQGYLLAMEPNPHWRNTMSVKNPCESHPSYIMEKLGMGLSDAVALSLILDRVGKELRES